jgi:hypothetical protein
MGTDFTAEDVFAECEWVAHEALGLRFEPGRSQAEYARLKAEFYQLQVEHAALGALYRRMVAK